jgi:hypothetical protein
MLIDESTTHDHDPYAGRTRQRLLTALAVAAALVLAGALHLAGLLPPG